MKTLTVRLPDALAAQIDSESRRRRVSKSDVVRERLSAPAEPAQARSDAFDSIADLVGTVDSLPAGLSANKKRHLKAAGYGHKRTR